MLLKILLTLGLIYVVYIAFFKKPALKSETNQSKQDAPQKEAVDEMVECAQCGTFTSANEVIHTMGRTFCSKECVKEAT